MSSTAEQAKSPLKESEMGLDLDVGNRITLSIVNTPNLGEGNCGQFDG